MYGYVYENVYGGQGDRVRLRARERSHAHPVEKDEPRRRATMNAPNGFVIPEADGLNRRDGVPDVVLRRSGERASHIGE